MPSRRATTGSRTACRCRHTSAWPVKLRLARQAEDCRRAAIGASRARRDLATQRPSAARLSRDGSGHRCAAASRARQRGPTRRALEAGRRRRLSRVADQACCPHAWPDRVRLEHGHRCGSIPGVCSGIQVAPRLDLCVESVPPIPAAVAAPCRRALLSIAHNVSALDPVHPERHTSHIAEARHVGQEADVRVRFESSSLGATGLANMSQAPARRARPAPRPNRKAPSRSLRGCRLGVPPSRVLAIMRGSASRRPLVGWREPAEDGQRRSHM